MAFRLNGVAVKSGGPEDRLLLWDRVHDMAGISRTTVWRMQQSGAFPTPVPVSPGRVAWWESELTAWKTSRSNARPLKPPMQPRVSGRTRQASERLLPATSDARVQQGIPLTQVKPQVPSKPRRHPKLPDCGQSDFGF